MIKPLDTLIALKVISLSGELTSTDKRVAAMLIEHFNRKTGQCDPSMDTMADLIGVDRRTVVRCIHRLAKSGLFRKIRHGGKFHRNSYEPMWSNFHHLDDVWRDLRKARRAAFASPNMSLCERQPGRAASGKDATQTYLKNHCKETLGTDAPKLERPVLCEVQEDGSADFGGWIGAESTLERLKKRIGEAACKQWFGNVDFVGYRDGIIFLSASNLFCRDSIINRYEPMLLTCFSSDYPKLFRIEFEIRGQRGGSFSREHES